MTLHTFNLHILHSSTKHISIIFLDAFRYHFCCQLYFDARFTGSILEVAMYARFSLSLSILYIILMHHVCIYRERERVDIFNYISYMYI